MKIKQIRNATIRIEYAGKTFLVDPWLEKKHGLGSFEDIPGRPFHVPDPVKEFAHALLRFAGTGGGNIARR